jgi:hypothetical protein
MLVNIPQPDHSQFTELGDGHVHMSLATMEKYLYPTLYLMRYLHERGENNLPGGIESVITYSFFAQGQFLPQSRTMHDLSVLRNTVFPTGLDLHFQIKDNIESAEGLCSQPRSSLKRLKEANDLPSWDTLVDGGQEMLDKRQEDIDSLLKLYMDQATKDYHTSKLDKERLLLYAHLSQQQAIQVLELHGRLAESMDKSKLLIEKALGDRLEDTNDKLDKAIRLIMKQNQDVISNMLVEATTNITEFDVLDMQALMASFRKRRSSKMLLIKTPCLQAKIQSYECIFHSCPSNIAILSL